MLTSLRSSHLGGGVHGLTWLMTPWRVAELFGLLGVLRTLLYCCSGSFVQFNESAFHVVETVAAIVECSCM